MIYVNEPLITARAKQYVNSCLDDGFISGVGPYVEKFENAFAKYLNVDHAIAVSNGTTALHLALDSIGIKPGDEVLVPDLTIISCAFAVMYLGAKPVLVDVQPDTGNLDPRKIEQKITSKTKAIMVVHLYGHPADMDEIMAISRKHNLLVIEDSAEAHGATYKKAKVGSIGDVATFSFYANKVLATGEGGMVVTNNTSFAERAKSKRDLAHKKGKRFFHEELGYNYRMSNIHAAIGLAHLEEIELFLEKKKDMESLYNNLLADCPSLEIPAANNYVTNTRWMYHVLVAEKSHVSRDQLMQRLKDEGIDTRTYFYPLHQQPVLGRFGPYNKNDFLVADDLSARGLYLPSGLAITDKEIRTVCRILTRLLKTQRDD